MQIRNFMHLSLLFQEARFSQKDLFPIPNFLHESLEATLILKYVFEWL